MLFSLRNITAHTDAVSHSDFADCGGHPSDVYIPDKESIALRKLVHAIHIDFFQIQKLKVSLENV